LEDLELLGRVLFIWGIKINVKKKKENDLYRKRLGNFILPSFLLLAFPSLPSSPFLPHFVHIHVHFQENGLVGGDLLRQGLENGGNELAGTAPYREGRKDGRREGGGRGQAKCRDVTYQSGLSIQFLLLLNSSKQYPASYFFS